MGALKSELIAQIPKLRAYALILCRNATEADDLVQEALVRAWRFQSGFQPGTNLRAWLFKILRNTFLGSLRQRRVVGTVDVAELDLVSEPDQEWRLRYREMLEALAELPEAGREALLLVTASGLSYEEAAVVCGCSVGTVKSRVSRARSRLAELIDFGTRAPAPRTASAVATAM